MATERRYEVGYFVWLASMGGLAGVSFGLRAFGPGGREQGMAAAGFVLVPLTALVGEGLVWWATAPPTAETLHARLRDDSVQVRRDAAAELGRRRDPASVPALRAALKDPDAEARRSAAEAIGSIGPAAREAVPDLVALVEDPGVPPAVLAEAALALQRLGHDTKPFVPALLDAMEKAYGWPRVGLIRAVMESGARGDPVDPALIPRLVPALRAALKDPEPYVPASAARLLGKVGRDGAADLAIPLLREAVWEIPPARPGFPPVYGGEADFRFRTASADALADIGAPAAADLAALLAHPNESIRSVAARVIPSLGPDAARPLIKALSDRDPVVRVKSAEALGLLRPPARGALEALLDVATTGPTHQLRQAATRAVHQIAPEDAEQLLSRRRDEAGEDPSAE